MGRKQLKKKKKGISYIGKQRHFCMFFCTAIIDYSIFSKNICPTKIEQEYLFGVFNCSFSRDIFVEILIIEHNKLA